jgi:hypothetical protein
MNDAQCLSIEANTFIPPMVTMPFITTYVVAKCGV